MKNYFVFEYVFDSSKDQYSDLKGPIKAFVQAEHAFEALEKAGFTDAGRYFAEPIRDEELKKMKADIKEEKELLEKLDKQIDSFIGDAVKRSLVCPNCGKELDTNYECPACRYGMDEVAIGNVVVTKKMIDKMEMEMKKQAKKKPTKKKVKKEKEDWGTIGEPS
jgi:hypothetical protein